jgi:hypothetical protein
VGAEAVQFESFGVGLAIDVKGNYATRHPQRGQISALRKICLPHSEQNLWDDEGVGLAVCSLLDRVLNPFATLNREKTMIIAGMPKTTARMIRCLGANNSPIG